MGERMDERNVKSKVLPKAFDWADSKSVTVLDFQSSARTRTAALRTESRMCRLSWFLDPGGWSKAAAVGLYFIFPGICTLSL
ncbi:hypothetical protein STEG23_003141, partial [Scotinomys teguina]